jgi:PAS domain S-box-containing protein
MASTTLLAFEPLAAASAALLVAAFIVTTWVLWRRCARLSQHVRWLVSRHRSAMSRASVRRAAERSGESRYWQHVRNSNAAVIVTTPEGGIVAASRDLLDMLGYADEAEFRRITAFDLYANPRDREQRLGATLKERGEARNSEFRMKRRDGREIDVLTTVRVITDSGGTFYEGVLTDITTLKEAAAQRQQLEAQLHLARKLEVIGQLASGIAHEINTPIQFICDNTHFLKGAFDRMKSLLDDRRSANAGAALGKGESSIPSLLKDVTEAFEGSFEGIERVTETVRAMKEFAHPGDAEKSATDLNDAIRTTLIVARNEYKHVADINTQFGEIPSIDCRRAEINKVLLNLIVNAAHAIESAASNRPGKGTITLTTASDASHVVVTIADTGCGIPRAVISRIFDPFFTTKPVGKGTGQGLAIARSIVDNHNGRLEVESTVGVGTTFIIRLPLTNVELKSPSALAVADTETIG